MTDQNQKDTNLSKNMAETTAAAREGKLDPVIGRDDEIRRTIQILVARTKTTLSSLGSQGWEKPQLLKAADC